MKPIAKMLIEMARFYSYELGERQLEMYVGVMSQFPEDLVLEAGRKYVLDIKNTRFPMPPHLIMKDHLPQRADNKDLARLTATRIREAVTKFGWPNPREAKEHIGDAGWRVVERSGGWQYLCENLGVDLNETSFIAQARDQIEAELNLQGAGIDTTRPAIEQSKSGGVLGLVSSLAEQKSLDEKK